jgi:hypothetical protein
MSSNARNSYLDFGASIRKFDLLPLTNAPRANANPLEVDRRMAALGLPYMRPLVKYVQALRRAYPSAEVPDFDPLGGGVEADILFLLEKPGPKTSRRGGGSGLISICNDDPSAEASWHFLKQAGIDVGRTAHWNTIPEWDGTRAHSAADVNRGLAHLVPLIELLPRLQTIVTVGLKANKTAPLIRQCGLRHITSAHPSPLVRASNPELWLRIPEQWAEAA